MHSNYLFFQAGLTGSSDRMITNDRDSERIRPKKGKTVTQLDSDRIKKQFLKDFDPNGMP